MLSERPARKLFGVVKLLVRHFGRSRGGGGRFFGHYERMLAFGRIR